MALSGYVRPIAYCEIDRYCQGVLLSRMATGELSNGPIWDDISTFEGKLFNEIVDIIYGGFPCQDISIAGNGKGLEGERSGLFFEIIRLCCEIKPRFIFLENVPAITTRGGSQVVREIASLGYDCRWCIISAASVGALHRRERWFFLAHSSSESANRHEKRKEEEHTMFTYSSFVGNTTREHWQKIVSEMDKCSNGIPHHVDRLRALGNAVVPDQVKKAFKILMGMEC